MLSPLDSLMSSIVPFIVTVGSVIIYGCTFMYIFRSIRDRKRSPVLTVDATVVSRRHVTSPHPRSFGRYESMQEMAMSQEARTFYYVTFEVESGDRMEFSLPDREYGLLAEGDVGRLTFQGTRYLRFERGSR